MEHKFVKKETKITHTWYESVLTKEQMEDVEKWRRGEMGQPRWFMNLKWDVTPSKDHDETKIECSVMKMSDWEINKKNGIKR